MKKWIAWVLILTLGAALLAGCGGNSGSNTGNDAQESSSNSSTSNSGTSNTGSSGADMVFAWWGNQERNERTQSAIELYEEQNEGVSIEGQFSEWADYWDKLATSAAGNAMPALIQMDYKYLDQYVANNLLLDLQPYVDSGALDLSDCSEDLVNAGRVGDGLYAVCIGINSPALLYDKTITDAAGVEIHDNMTVDEFIDICRTVYETTGYKTNIAYNNAENYVEYFVRSNDVVMFEQGKLGGTAEDYIAYMKLYEQGIEEGWHVDPAIFAERTIGSVEQDPLVYGSSPATRSWCGFAYTNQLVATKKAAPADSDIQMTTWPAIDPEKSDYLKPGQFISVAASTDDPDAAVAFVNWLTNSVDCNNILLAERGIPLSTAVAEAISPNLDQDTQDVATFLNEVVAETSSQINPPSANGYSEVADYLNQLEEQVCYQQMTAEEAGQLLFDRGNEIMAQKAREDSAE